jgi:glycosyltransferase involved in cell wall biosynthesis
MVFGLNVPLSVPLYGGLFARLRDAGLEVQVVTREPVPLDDRRTGFAYQCIPMRWAIAPFADFWTLSPRMSLIREFRTDLVWLATPKASFLGRITAWAGGVPRRIHHVWGCSWDGMTGRFAAVVRFLDHLACRGAIENIAVSRSFARLLSHHRMSADRSELLEYGGTKSVDLDRFCPDGEAFFCLHDPPTVGIVGRFARDRDIAFLPRIFARVQAFIPEVRLLVAGWINSDAPSPAATYAALEADPAVDCLGQVRDDTPAMRRMDVLCFPSRREGLPNAVIEAAAVCGVPTVGWRVTGTEDAVDEGQTGHLVPPFGIGAMAERIVSILSSPTLRREFARNARAFVAERWCSSRVEESIAAHVLGERVPRRDGK